MAEIEHKIRRRHRIDRDLIFQYDDGELEFCREDTKGVQLLTKRRCSCGEVFHSDEKAIEHLRSVNGAKSGGPDES